MIIVNDDELYIQKRDVDELKNLNNVPSELFNLDFKNHRSFRGVK